MTPEETAGVLRYASTLDPWLGQTSAEEGTVMITGWANMLQAVDAAVAMQAVTDHYAEEGARTLQPGDLLAAWRRVKLQETRAVDQQESAALQAASAAQVMAGMSGHLGSYLRDCLDAISEGRDPGTVPLPEGLPRLDDHTDSWQRRCTFPSICACSHTECRGGWLDQESQVKDGHGRLHVAAKRCPVCADGILMAQERGIARRPSHQRARR